jgi:hypothetical protein
MKSYSKLFTVISITILSLSLKAREVRNGHPGHDITNTTKSCTTLEACRHLQEKVETKIQSILKKNAPDLTAIARNPDGSVRAMSQYEAERYCLNMGLRLPTARELAHYAQLRGAKGLSASAKNGFILIEESDNSGKMDRFYYSNVGYEQPLEDDSGWQFLWSSSLLPYDSIHQNELAFALDLESGRLGQAHHRSQTTSPRFMDPRTKRTDIYVARCVREKSSDR